MSLPDLLAKRISDRIRRFKGLEMCTGDKVQRVQRGEDIGDPFVQVAIVRELEEYGFTLEEGSGA